MNITSTSILLINRLLLIFYFSFQHYSHISHPAKGKSGEKEKKNKIKMRSDSVILEVKSL